MRTLVIDFFSGWSLKQVAHFTPSLPFCRLVSLDRSSRLSWYLWKTTRRDYASSAATPVGSEEHTERIFSLSCFFFFLSHSFFFLTYRYTFFVSRYNANHTTKVCLGWDIETCWLFSNNLHHTWCQIHDVKNVETYIFDTSRILLKILNISQRIIAW